MSNQIHKLEQTLGAELFVRTSRMVELTPAGRKVAETASSALNREVFTHVRLTGDEQASLYTLLQQLRRAFGDFT